jgi:DNA mismatch repair protein MutL
MQSEATEGVRGRARIALLSDQVKNQIAAGEVIERPASLVKELVENAIDAGARRIEIDLEEGGTRLVRVRDDGTGMPREDLELAFVAHATSKLREASDLEHIGSLGFRGEALASMGAVARCRISTRAAEDETGWSIDDEGGRIGRAKETGGPRGTIVEVRDLFFNIPARRRFLKRPSTELARALDVIQRIALAQIGIGFVATHDGKRLFDVDESMDLRARIRRTFGAELAESIVPVQSSREDLHINGFVAPPRLARADTSRQMWFLNGRPLRDKVLTRALKEGYRGFMFESRQPIAFLALAMNPARVDVNVHPAKSEVRFRDESALFGFIVRALREALQETDLSTPGARLIDRVERREARLFDSQRVGSPDRFQSASHAPRAVPEPFTVLETPAAKYSGGSSEPPTSRAGSQGVIDDAIHASIVPGVQGGIDRAIDPAIHAAIPAAIDGAIDPAIHAAREPASDGARGACLQIACTYILREVPGSEGGGFEIIDQHALHERVTFESLIVEMRAGRLEMQRFLVPEIVECSRAELELVSGRSDALREIGIDLAPFGATALAVHGLPARLARPNAAAIVREVIQVLESPGEPRAERVLEEVLHRAACRSSVMAGDALTPGEIAALLARGARLESDQTCVHGRPTRVRFTLADLERAFQRR